MRELRLHDQRRPDDGIAARPGRARLADHLPLRPGVPRGVPPDRAQACADLPHAERRAAHAGRGRARPRGGRALAGSARDAGAEPRLRCLRQGRATGSRTAPSSTSSRCRTTTSSSRMRSTATCGSTRTSSSSPSSTRRRRPGRSTTCPRSDRSPDPRCSDAGGLRLLGGQDPARDGCLAARRLRRRAAEVPGRPARHVTDDRERRRLGADPGEPGRPRASFLSMLDWKEQWLDGDKFPFTPSVVDVHGVEAACDELLDEGLEASIARHDLAARACRSGVKAMGLDLWPRSEEISAACVTAIAVPDDLTDTRVRNHCRRALRRDDLWVAKGPKPRADRLTSARRRLCRSSGWLRWDGRSPISVRASTSARGRRRLSRPCRRRRWHWSVDASAVRSPSTQLARRGERAGGRYRRGCRLLLRWHGAPAAAEARLRCVRPPRRPEERRGLRGISLENDSLVIRGGDDHREIERSPLVLERLPALARMERRVANIRVREVGTLGGNLCFSDPHSDPATFLLAADAELECRRGDEPPRRLPIAEFVVGPYQTALQPGEVLTAVRVPLPGPARRSPTASSRSTSDGRNVGVPPCPVEGRLVDAARGGGVGGRSSGAGKAGRRSSAVRTWATSTGTRLKTPGRQPPRTPLRWTMRTARPNTRLAG